MLPVLRTALLISATALLGACASPTTTAPPMVTRAAFAPALYPGETPAMRRLIVKYAAIHDIPESLLHRVIQRESDYRAGARNGPYYGLMQILPQTARGMGFKGEARDLLNAETNLKYAGKYLRGAWLLSNGDEATAVGWYARGYYYEAKRRGVLVETGLRPAK